MQLEGKNSVFEALQANKPLEKILTIANPTDSMSAQILRMARQQKINIQYVNKNVLDKKSLTKKHQNFIKIFG